MPIQFGVNYKSPTNRLVKLLEIEVVADGFVVPETKTSRRGAHRFDIPSKALFVTMKVTIPKPPGSASTSTLNMLDVFQKFHVVHPGVGAPTLVPDALTPSKLEPRLTMAAGLGAATKPGGLFLLDLDVEFLDVTDYAEHLPGWVPFTTTHGTKMVVFEFTGGTPKVWLAFVPKKVLDTPLKNVRTLMFFRPVLHVKDDNEVEKPDYHNIDDAQERVRASYSRYWSDQAFGPPPEALGNSKAFPNYQDCGFDRQLNASGKKVILVWPVPHLGSFGDAAGPRMVDLLRSLVVALWDSGYVGGKNTNAISFGRVGLAGYSWGGQIAIDAFVFNKSRIDELYLFDPAKIILGAGDLAAWFATGGKKLRGVGGGYQHVTLQSIAAFIKSPDATCWPDKLDFWETDPSYKRGLARAGKVAEAFTAAGGVAPPDSASAVTGIFLVSTSGTISAISTVTLVLRGEFPTTPPTHRDRTVVGASHAEAASIAVVRALTAGGATGPVDSKTFDKVINAITKNETNEPDRIRAIRHEWTVFGGLEFTPGTYVGFFQQALELSGF